MKSGFAARHSIQTRVHRVRGHANQGSQQHQMGKQGSGWEISEIRVHSQTQHSNQGSQGWHRVHQGSEGQRQSKTGCRGTERVLCALNKKEAIYHMYLPVNARFFSPDSWTAYCISEYFACSRKNTPFTSSACTRGGSVNGRFFSPDYGQNRVLRL